MRRKLRKRLTSALRTVLPPPSAPNERWSMDFVSDQLVGGTRLRAFNVVDDFTRECLAIEVDSSLPGLRATRVLESIAADRQIPKFVICDNGPEFTGSAFDSWADRRGVRIHFIRSGKPVENAYPESFNGKPRDECLNENWFITMVDARTRIEAWRIDYNQVRPHSGLDNLTPSEFALCHNPVAAGAAFYALSADLIHWSAGQLIAEARIPWCDTDPQKPGVLEPVFVLYSSLVDHDDVTVNFERTGRTPYLYYTRFNDGGLDRDLVRVPLTFTRQN